MSKMTEVAILGGGCFWCLEAVFAQLRGVLQVRSGYCGGHLTNPTYEQVCSGTTGHAEVVRIEYDPNQIHFRDLLEVFFAIHDPTSLNRQGDDIGTQYRSAIFCQNQSQKSEAEEHIRQLGTQHQKPVVTEIVDAQNFYPAEDYHDRYFARNPNQGYCRAVIDPKLQKFKKQFSSKLQTT